MGDTGLVRASAKNNTDIPYIDPFTFKQNFSWIDWKEIISPQVIRCDGIQDWHVVKIRPIVNYIEVANSLGELFTKKDIFPTNYKDLIWSEKKKIQPKGLNDKRLKELKYFESYVDSVHHPFISEIIILIYKL